MRYITTRKEHACAVCKQPILKGEKCIQSQARRYLMYHEKCHALRFQDSVWHKPNNKKPEQNQWGGING
jgi:hypothetical protein